MPRSVTELEQTRSFRLRASAPVPAPQARDTFDSALVTFEAMYDGIPQIALRDQVVQRKHELDPYDVQRYRAARDTVFPLAHSGVKDRRARFDNRAGHKLIQSMEAIGAWDSVVTVPTAPNDEVAQEAAQDGDAPRDAAPRPERRRAVTFVDICGGPGAFSQAVFQTAPPKIKVKGFGLTLMDPTVPENLLWYPQLLAKPNYAVSFGVDGTGNIYVPGNVEAFVAIVKGGAGGAHLAVADGGFEVDHDKQHLQEALSAQIVFAQWYVAVRTLNAGGSFVLKLFDSFTTFTRSLLFLSCFAFEEVFVVKPLHSRAVNSERYLSCNGFRGLPAAWMSFLAHVHANGFVDGRALGSLVPAEVLNSDADFTAAMDTSVAEIATAQLEALQLVLDELARANPPVAAATVPAEAAKDPAASEAPPQSATNDSAKPEGTDGPTS